MAPRIRAPAVFCRTGGPEGRFVKNCPHIPLGREVIQGICGFGGSGSLGSGLSLGWASPN